jgi:hypothetical protein
MTLAEALTLAVSAHHGWVELASPNVVMIGRLTHPTHVIALRCHKQVQVIQRVTGQRCVVEDPGGDLGAIARQSAEDYKARQARKVAPCMALVTADHYAAAYTLFGGWRLADVQAIGF